MTASIDSLLAYREGNRLEAKSAQVSLPKSLWETYSAFANTDGGCIVLGVEETRSGLKVVGVPNPDNLVKLFWDAVNNPAKVSANLLTNSDVSVEEKDGLSVIVIRVPRASHDARPVFLDANPLMRTFRRNGEGDYRCTQREVSAMLRDNSDGVQDRAVLPHLEKDAICPETVRRYRNALRTVRPQHPWLDLENDDFLLRIGAIGRSADDDRLHPTRAGLLMFGYEYEIVREYPLYFMEYREVLGDARWDDRVVTNDGEWSGNIFDFWRIVLPRIIVLSKRPFDLEGGVRVDDTPLHKAYREALANTLVHADYYGEASTVVSRELNRLVFINPGTVRIDPKVAQVGGISSQRNPALMTMFNLIGVGERAGSGFDVMRQGCSWADAPNPIFRENLSPDYVELEFPFAVRERAGSGSSPNGMQGGGDNAETDAFLVASSIGGRGSLSGLSAQDRVLEYISRSTIATRGEIEKLLGVSRSSAGNLLSAMVEGEMLKVEGAGRATTYRLA